MDPMYIGTSYINCEPNKCTRSINITPPTIYRKCVKTDVGNLTNIQLNLIFLENCSTEVTTVKKNYIKYLKARTQFDTIYERRYKRLSHN